MTRKRLGIISVLIALAMLAAAVAVAADLPDAMRLPIHWGIDGVADRFAGKWFALLLPVAIAASVSLLLYFLPMFETRGRGLAQSQGLYLWSWAALLLMSVTIQLVVTSTALGWNFPVDRVVTAAVGVMLVLIGNQLGKSRRMYLIGIRTPWTLASEYIWIKTHRLGGKMMVAAGLIAIVASAIALPAGSMVTIMLLSLAVAVIVPIGYSFLLWRHAQSAR